MKKFCKSFLCTILFASIFALVSCGNISDSTATNGGGIYSSSSSNSVKFTLPPKSARSASAGSADDVDYYNVYINRQSFENAQPGTQIQSAPITAGTEVTVTVEAFGKAKDGSAVVKENCRVAYYTTTLSMPSSPVSLNIKMSEHKTMWHKVTLNMNGFNGQTSKSEYIEDGSSYTLPDYGTYKPDVGAPKIHRSWLYTPDPQKPDDVIEYQPGETVTITSDMELVIDYTSYVTIKFDDGGTGFGNHPDWESGPIYLEEGAQYTTRKYTDYAGKRHTGWSYYYDTESAKPGETVTIPSGQEVTFKLVAEELLKSKPQVGSIIMKDGSVKSVTDQLNSDDAIAVVYKVDSNTKTAWAVGKNQSQNSGNGIEWCNDYANGYNTKFTSLLCEPDNTSASPGQYTWTKGQNTDGSGNWEKLKNELGENDDTHNVSYYVAWHFVKDYGNNNCFGTNFETGWYLPTIAELVDIWKASNAAGTPTNVIDNALQAVGGDTFTGNDYWSSSQVASQDDKTWVLLDDGDLNNSARDSIGVYACAIRKFAF